MLEFAEDHEEFRQVDIRTLPGIDPTVAKSSMMALAFEALRQEGVIRFARQDGNNKFFRLTRQAMNGAVTAMPPRKKEDRPPAIDLTVWGIADTELLGIVDDLADENGWTTNLDVRLQLGEDVEGERRSGVGPRIGWMRRYGWLERDATDKRRYRLTAIGHAILDNPELSRTFEAALEKLNPAQRLRLTREISQAGSNSPDEIKAALRREWQRNLQRPRGR